MPRKKATPVSRTDALKQLAGDLPPEKDSGTFVPSVSPNLTSLKTSDTIGKLAAAILSVNKVVRIVTHDTQGYNYTYASLSTVLQTIDEPLLKAGIAIIQFPCSSTGSIGVVTRLVHAPSGEWIEGAFLMPIPHLKGTNVTQNAGAAITYARRYAIVSVLGLVAEADTDAAD
jgi:hypothetical protein